MFRLTESFVEQFKNKQPKWGPLGYFVFKRTYARTLQNGKSEEFWQTLQRVIETVYTIQKRHCEQLKLPWKDNKAQKSAQEMFQRMWDFKFLPPGRGLWAMSLDLIEKKGSGALNNCAFVSTDEINVSFAAPFTFAMDMLMLGVGVGFDTLGKNTVTLRKPKVNGTFVVEDTREGWVKLVETVLESFMGNTDFPATIDYSKIRKKGEPIKTFGGTSSGPEPLAQLVNEIMCIVTGNNTKSEFSKDYIQTFSQSQLDFISLKITSTQIVDIFNCIGKCVVSGNVRRSAELAIGDSEDEFFILLKQDKEKLNSHRWASNNSISCIAGMNYEKFTKFTAINGEPGYVWLDNARRYARMKDKPNGKDVRVKGFNPCVEMSLESFELCNLVETFPSNHETYDDFQKTLKYAYLYAKTVTLIPTHDPRTNAVMMRNRRIGTSMSGITQAFKKFGRRAFLEMCDKGYNYIKELDEQYSDWLCVPKSIKVTTVKPSGTVSLLPGVLPGVHYPESEFYVRNIRISDNSPLVEICKEAGYIIEKDKYSKDSLVISFPIKEKYFTKGKQDVTLWEQMENTAQMQYYWSDNSVSVTISFKKDEANQIKDALELYETRIKSVSFLPLEDHGYEQAPYIPITEKEYERLISKIKPLKLKEDVHELTEKYCDGETCLI